MDKLKAVLTRREDPEAANITEEDRGFMAEALDASTLSYSTRIKGFAACFILGVFVSILASVLFSITWNLRKFFSKKSSKFLKLLGGAGNYGILLEKIS